MKGLLIIISMIALLISACYGSSSNTADRSRTYRPTTGYNYTTEQNEQLYYRPARSREGSYRDKYRNPQTGETYRRVGNHTLINPSTGEVMHVR